MLSSRYAEKIRSDVTDRIPIPREKGGMIRGTIAQHGISVVRNDFEMEE
jgi:hypothetical protein